MHRGKGLRWGCGIFCVHHRVFGVSTTLGSPDRRCSLRRVTTSRSPTTRCSTERMDQLPRIPCAGTTATGFGYGERSDWETTRPVRHVGRVLPVVLNGSAVRLA